MTRVRIVTWLTAVLLASLGGAVVAIPVTLALRNWLNADGGSMDLLVIVIGYFVWALTAAVISAVWLRRAWGR